MSLRLLMVAATALLAACSLDPQRAATSSPSSASTTTDAAESPDYELVGAVKVDEFNDQATGKENPAQGGEIVVSFNAEPHTLSTWLSTSDSYSSYISYEYIYDTLLWQDP
jgi:hypothetical protein